MSEIKLNSIEDAVKDFKEGKFVIVVDDEDRENEGDLIIAAEKRLREPLLYADGVHRALGRHDGPHDELDAQQQRHER